MNAGEKHKAEKRRSSSEDDDPDGEGGEGGAEGAHNKKKMDIDRECYIRRCRFCSGFLVTLIGLLVFVIQSDDFLYKRDPFWDQKTVTLTGVTVTDMDFKDTVYCILQGLRMANQAKLNARSS